MANASLVFDLLARDRASATFGKVGKAAQGAGKNFQEANKHGAGLAASLGGMPGLVRKAASGFLAFEVVKKTTGYVKDAITTYEDFGRSTRKLQRETGASAESASRLLFVFQHYGIDTAAASKSLGFLSKQIAGTQEKTKTTTEHVRVATGAWQKHTVTIRDASGHFKTLTTMVPVTRMESFKKVTREATGPLAKLGITVRDSAGHFKTVDVVLLQVADKFKGMPDGAKKTALALQLFGKSGKDLLPVLNQGSAGISALEKEADRLGVTLSQKNVSQIAAYVVAHKRLHDTLFALKLTLGKELFPAFAGVAAKMDEFVTAHAPQIRRAFQTIGRDVSGLATVLGVKGLGAQVDPNSAFGRFLARLKGDGPALKANFLALAGAAKSIGTSLAGAGPGMLSVVGGLARLVSLLPPGLVQALAWAIALSKLSTATRGLKAALTGEMLGHLSELIDKLKGSESLEAGAAASNSRLAGMAGMIASTGPWGIAVAGAIAAVGIWAIKTRSHNDWTKRLSQSLDQQTGAITRNSETEIANKLEKEGVLKAGQLLGINTRDLTLAASGNRAALARVNAELKRQQGGLDLTFKSTGNLTDAQHQQQTALNNVRDAVNGNNKAVAEARRKLDEQRAAANRVRDALHSATGATQTATAKTGIYSGAIHTLDQKIRALKNRVVKVQTSGVPGAQRQITGLQRQINALTGRKLILEFQSKLSAAAATKAGRFAAKGGPIVGSGTGTSDSVPFMGSHGEHVLTAAEVAKAGGHGAVFAMRRAILRMAAGGPLINVRAQIDPYARALRGAEARGVAGAGQRAMSMFNLLATSAPGVGNSVTRWANVILAVLRALGQSAGNLAAVERRIRFESGGNPDAINLTDINAQRGYPSRGLMQTIPQTFNAYAGAYRGRGITDPFANIYAGLRYAISRYGSIAAIDPLVRPRGYDRGGYLPPGLSLAYNGTGRPEPVGGGVTVNVYGYVGNETQLANEIARVLRVSASRGRKVTLNARTV